MTIEGSATGTTPVVDALVQVSFAVLDVFTRSAVEHDLSATQLRLVGILRDREPSMAALADYLRLDRSSVSGLIDRAERRGLVTRRTSSEDARVTIVSLTALGVEIGEQAGATVTRALEQLLEHTAARDRARFLRLAKSVIEDGPNPGQLLNHRQS